MTRADGWRGQLAAPAPGGRGWRRKVAGCLLVLAAGATHDATGRGRADAILSEALNSRNAYERLRVLTDTIGPRLAGSAAEPKAVAWARSELEKDGITARLEPVMVPVWVRGEERASIVSPIERPLVILGLGGTVGTPSAGITAEVVVVGSNDELRALGAAKVSGRIVLFDNPFVRTGEDFADYSRAVVHRGSGAVEAARLGAVAALVRSVGTATLRTPHTGALRYVDDVGKIPAAAVTIEDAMLIRRLATAGDPVSVHLYLGARSEPDRPGANVVGEIRGSALPEEVVLIVAHLDSWDVGQGAVDNGAGCAMVLETMRLIGSGPAPRRTVRAVLTANEENGLRGGRGYRDAHVAELGRHVAALEADSGGGRPVGLSVKAGQGGLDAFKALATPLLSPLGAARITEGRGGADTGQLEAYGVPLIGLRTESSRYFDWHHTPADTLDKVDPDELQQAAAALAVTTWALADAAEALPRIPPADPNAPRER